jgi:hypothetical protein
MAKKIGLISINLEAGTAQFNSDLAAAKQKMKDFAASARGNVNELSHASVSGMQSASAALRLFEGNLTNNLRAVENFVSKTLGMGPALKAVFPLVGGAAFGGLLFELGEKVAAFYKTISEHSEKAVGAFAELNAAAAASNAQLQVANDRLENTIAKLEHRPQNLLKLQLDEATASALKLSEALDKDLAALSKLVNEQKQGFWADLFSRQAGVEDVAKELGGATGFGGFRASVRGMSPQDAYTAFDAEITKLQGWLDNALQTTWKNQFGLAGIGGREGQRNRVEVLQGVIQRLTEEQQGLDLGMKNAALGGRAGLLQGTQQELDEQQRELKAGYDRMLAAEEAFGELMASEKLAFRENELKEISQYGTKYKTLRQELMTEIGKLEQESFREAREARDKDAKDQERYLEEMSRAAVEWQKRSFDAIRSANKELLSGAGLEPRPELPQATITATPQSRLAGTPLGQRVELQQAGIASVAVQQAEIDNEQRILDAMAKGGYTLGQQIEQRTKLLELQNKLNESIKGADAADRYRQAQIDELLHLGTLEDGMKAFWTEMEKQAEKPGVIFFNGMTKAVDGIADSLAKVMTGQKGNWGQMLKGVGEQMAQQTMKATIQTGLGDLAKHFGLGGLGRHDGQTRNTPLYTSVVDDTGNLLFNGGPSATAPDYAGPGSIFGGWTGGSVFNFGGLSGYLGQVLRSVAPVSQPSPTSVVVNNSITVASSDDQSTAQRLLSVVTAATKAAIAGSLKAQGELAARTLVTSTLSFP